MSLVPLVGALLLAGCGGGSTESPTAVAFETLRRDALTGGERQKNMVIKDSDAWQTLWVEYSRYITPAPAVPTIDFRTNMVVGVFMGLPPLSCSSTRIESITRTADKIAVRYVETVPPAGAACAAVLASPAHLVVTERSDLPFEFVKEVR